MALGTRIYDTTQQPTSAVRINTVYCGGVQPILHLTPGILSIRCQQSFDSPVPTVDLEVSEITSWIKRGQAVLIDAGYSNEHVRVFTGGVLARGDEDPDSYRTQCKVTGATSTDGSQITATASLIGGPAVWPPIPASQCIDFGVDNHLIWDEATAASEAARELTERARVPTRPTGQILRRTIRCVGDLYGAFRSYQLAANDFSGQTIKAAMGTVLANSGVSQYDLSQVPAYTLAASGATLERMPGSQQLAKLMIKGCKVMQLASGVVMVKIVTPQPAPTAAFTYSTTTQAYARIIDASGELQVPFNPLLQIGMTIAVDITELSISGNWFLWGHRWEIGPNGAWSYLDLRRGDDFSGTVGINPVADFTYSIVQQVIGGTVYDVITFDATASHDPDGTISSYSWTDNQASHKISGTGSYKTIVVDPTTITAPWEVTLTVTDNSGLTGTVIQTIDVSSTSTAVILPAIGVANGAAAAFSPDGGQHWNRVAGATCISVACRPADGMNFGHVVYGFSDGHIARSTDGGASLTTVLAAVGSAINHIAWDWRNTLVVWAITETCKLYVSIDAGVTWGLFQDFRTVTYADGSTTTGALGNRIGLPAGGSVWIFGGDGAGNPLIAHDDLVTHNWVKQPIAGDLDTDTPGTATLRIADYVAPGDGMSTLILTNATGGGGSLVAIYSATDVPGAGTFTRATGLDAGLTDGRVILGDAPLSPLTRHALFNNRDVWSSTNGIAYTKAANVLPTGFTPNHGIFESDVLTGLPTLAGVYLIAAEDSTGTGAVLKSTDGLATVGYLWPAGGSFPTWTTGDKAKMLSIGAPGSTVPALNVNLYAQQNNGTTNPTTYARRVAKYTAGAWSLVTDPASASQEPVVALGKFGANFYRIAVKAGWVTSGAFHVGQLQRSADAITWSDVGPTAAQSGSNWWGTQAMDRAADGTLYLIATSHSSAYGGAEGPRVYKSTAASDGAVWTQVYEDATKDSGAWRQFSWITCHPSNPLAIAVIGERGLDQNVWYSLDAAGNFTNTTGATVQESNRARRMAMLGNNRLLALVGGFIYRSDNWGAAWTDPKGSAYSSSQDCLIRGSGNVAFASFNTGTVAIYRTQDGGSTTWIKLLDIAGLTGASYFRSLAYKADSDTLYIGTDSTASTNRVLMIENASTCAAPATPVDITANLDSLFSGGSDGVSMEGLAVA